MRQSGKIFSIAMLSLTLIVVGALIWANATGTISWGEWSLPSRSQGDRISSGDAEHAFDGIRNADIETSSAALTVGRSPDEQAHVNIHGDREYELWQEGDTLYFRWVEDWFVLWTDWGEERVDVLLPEGMVEVELDVSSGGLEVSDIACTDLYAESSSGGLQARNITAAQTADLSTSSGSLRAENITARAFYAEASSGSLTADVNEGVENVDISTSSGSIAVTLRDEVEGEIDASSGSVSLVVVPGQTVHCDASSGGVYINGERYRESGDNEGTLQGGDLELWVETSSGRITVEER